MYLIFDPALAIPAADEFVITIVSARVCGREIKWSGRQSGENYQA